MQLLHQCLQLGTAARPVVHRTARLPAAGHGHILEDNQGHAAQGRGLFQRLDNHVHILRGAVSDDLHIFEIGHGFFPNRPVKRFAQGLVEPLTGHRKQVQAGLAGGRLKVFPGFTAEIQHIPLARDQNRSGRVALQNQLFHQQLKIGSWQSPALKNNCTLARLGMGVHKRRREANGQHPCGRIQPPVNPALTRQWGEQSAGGADGLCAAQHQNPPGNKAVVKQLNQFGLQL